MKILQVTNSLMTGGAEKLVVDTTNCFTKKNLIVDVLLLDGSDSDLLKKLKKNKTTKIFSFGNTNNIYKPINIFKFRNFFNKYDIIHVHLFPSLYWIALSKFIVFSKTKLVYTEHNTTNRRRDSKFFKIFDKIIYGKYSKIITISNAVDINLKQYLGNKFQNKFHKIYNGIDLAVIEHAEAYKKEYLNYKETDKLILQVSSFTPQKDQKTLIKSLLNLPENYKLLLVGDGILKQDCIEFAKHNNLENRVKFLGIRSDVPQLLKSVDIVVLSSHYEGLSLSSVEGMASGKPFIASKVPGLEEVVLNFGLLFEQGDYLELSNQIMSLSLDDNYNNTISDACLRKSKEYDINNMVENYIKLYYSLL